MTMKASDREATALYESLAAVIGREAAGDFKVELDILLRRYLRDYQQRITDAEVARLLHTGAAELAERFECHRSTIYRRAERGRKVVALHPLACDKSAGASHS
jgi:hypothetical protein